MIQPVMICKVCHCSASLSAVNSRINLETTPIWREPACDVENCGCHSIAAPMTVIIEIL